MRIQPAPGMLVVKEDDTIMSKQSRIIIPDTARENDCARFGIVMRMGEKREELKYKQSSFNLTEGDVIIFHIHSSMPIRVDNDKFYLIQQDWVLGKWETV